MNTNELVENASRKVRAGTTKVMNYLERQEWIKKNFPGMFKNVDESSNN
jgi:hypothetical protein